ncbi:MAG: hypothetical protein PHX83_03510 [Acidobacteriia bacterium]|nr:hypothetical protein [Terriglobia bacterium]
MVVLLLLFARQRGRPGALAAPLRYDHKMDLRPFLKTQSSDIEYLPRLFDRDDFEYLRRQSFPPAEIERFRKERMTAVLDFLKSVREDFNRILFVHRYLARCAGRLSAYYEWVVLRERFRFAIRFQMVRWSFELRRRISHPAPLGIIDLAEVLERWRIFAEENLPLLNPLQLDELKSDLRLQMMQTESR